MDKKNTKKDKLGKLTAIAVFSLIFLLIVIITIFKYKNTFKYNEEDVTGNLPGNLYNKGLFCDYDGRIYFKNISDGGALYSCKDNLTDFKRISTDNVSYINVDGNHIYYSRMNLERNNESLLASFNSNGLYRCDMKGNKITSLYNSPTGLISLCGNDIIYQHYDTKTGLTLYSVGIDGKKEKKISDNPISPGCYDGKYMYYSEMDNDHYIIKYDIKSGSTSTYLKVRTMYPIINNNYIYYMDIDDNYCVHRYSMKTGETTKITDERCATYNISISGRYIYYQTDASDSNRLCRMDLTNNDVITIMDGNFNNINVTENYMFFSDMNLTKYYYVENGTNIPKAFEPEIEKN